MADRILFVDHSAHRHTRSNQFFLDVLSKIFAPQVVFFDPDGPFEMSQLIPEDLPDLAVLWQLDFLAPIFLARGIPTVVVPMYDGSAGMPDLHWRWMQGASVLCFSSNLAWRLRFLGLDTYLAKYFPEPVGEDQLPTFEELRGFLWQRRPDDGINVGMVSELFGDQLAQLHVHNAPDLPNIDGERYIIPFRNRLNITTTTWGGDNSEYLDRLARSNVFIAPRRTEGIGISFLEAMARGQLVIAHDAPTHTEYITNWVNGVLFNSKLVSWACFDKELVAQVARLGWRTVIEGRKRWLLSVSEVIEFIRQAAVPVVRDDAIAAMLAKELPKAYLGGIERYTAYLVRNLDLVAAMAGQPLSSIAGRAANGHDVNLDQGGASPMSRLPDVPFLDHDEIQFVGNEARPHLVQGWSYDEGTHVWIDGNTGVIGFRLEPTQKTYSGVTLSCKSPAMGGGNFCMLVINEQFVSSFEVPETWCKRSFLLPQSLRPGVNKLCIYAQQVASPPGDKRRLSLAVNSIRFEK